MYENKINNNSDLNLFLLSFLGKIHPFRAVVFPALILLNLSPLVDTTITVTEDVNCIFLFRGISCFSTNRNNNTNMVNDFCFFLMGHSFHKLLFH